MPTGIPSPVTLTEESITHVGGPSRGQTFLSYFPDQPFVTNLIDGFT